MFKCIDTGAAATFRAGLRGRPPRPLPRRRQKKT